MSDGLRRLETPLGTLVLAGDADGALVYLGFERHEPRPEIVARLAAEGVLTPDLGRLDRAAEELAAYARGELRTFTAPVAPRGTPFQRRVWAELQKIPYGATLSYGDLARRLGDPRLTRAVGAANGANPVSIVIPCHRVIGADGSLVGYAGGLEVKRALLIHEGALAADPYGWLES